MRWPSILLLIGALLSPGLPALDARADDCPSDRAAAREWGRRAIERIFENKFAPARTVETAAAFERCQARLAPEDLACLGNLRDFSRAVGLNYTPGHSLGATVPDREYYATLPHPGMMDIPPELTTPQFFRWMDRADAASVNAALRLIERINGKLIAAGNPELRWIAFVYDSPHLPTPDDTGTMGRFFIYVPGPKFDRYVQFGLRTDPSKPQPNGLSLITVDKTQSPPVARLRDFWRKRESGKVTLSTRIDEKGEVAHCYFCHKSAALPIYPDPRTFDRKRFFSAVREVNFLMREQAGADIAGIDRAGYGPGIGPMTSPLRTKEFLRACAKGRVAAWRLDRFEKAMRCTKCHDGESRGALNFPTMMTPLPTGGHLVQRFVVDHAAMPRRSDDLSADERHALVDCLYTEHYEGFDGRPGTLKAWLLQETCWNGK